MKKRNANPESARKLNTRAERTDRATLRRRLAERLRQVIGNPVIEEKELAAFDIVMSRRDVLKLGGSSLVVAGLVAAGVPPTAWGKRDPSLGVHPNEVGLTLEEQASVTQAVDISIGTELFQQTVYAKPVVSPQAAATHAVIEGARHRYRLQSVLDSLIPTEAEFLDKGHHWGPPELVQLEETANGWELVHYRHPWSAREDGATTDGLVRDVIMTAADGLSHPVKVLTISSPYNNLVTADGMSGAAYVIVVIDRDADGGAFLCVGTGTWAMTGSADATPEYPVEWMSMGIRVVLREVGNAQGHELWWDDKYVDMGHADPSNPATYIPAKSTEHIVLYYDNGPRVITLANNGTPGYIYLWIDMLLYPLAGQPKPTESTTPKMVHLQSNTDVPASGNDPPYRTDWVAFTSNVKNSDGTTTFTTIHVSHDGAYKRDDLSIWPEKGIYGRNQEYDTAVQFAYDAQSLTPPPPDGKGVQLDYTHMFNVHSFYGTANGYFVKLAHFQNVGLALFVVKSQLNATVGAGHFPLALPDIDGIGEITVLSGGVSKFDGFRFLASDANGNLFLLRHRRAVSAGTPYSAPIYGFNDADGNPRTHYSTTTGDPFPDGVAINSNLHTLDDWMAASNDYDPLNFAEPRNVLLNAALAFATDETALSQGVWLGNTYQAAYAPRRFPFDSAYVVIKRAQGGSDTDYSAYTMHNNVVTKTWHTRQIATQVLPEDPGLNESGDHYHATITPVNAYGRPVSPVTDDNAGLVIEVRADAPTTVVDNIHNLYYDVDRYTSFMAAPDPGTGQLLLAVKAESFGLVLYARLVDSAGLAPTAGDPAMLATAGATYPWQTANLAAQAQQRMGNDFSESVALLGDAAPLTDTNVYISGDSLTTASTQGAWQFKGGFQPSGGNSGNLGSLATYLNTSGQTMVGASSNLSLGASPDGVTVDPLTAVTLATPGASTGGVRFTYPAGTVVPSTVTFAAADGELGSVWSNVSHALHDALHWLQNVEAAVYDDLAVGAVDLVVDIDRITAIVSADIMKAVNGVEQELNEVVSSVEEYASVVINVVVTIVEQSFLYKLIEDIIALISLFQHVKDALSLADSLRAYYETALAGVEPPAGYSSWDEFQRFFGPASDLGDQMNTLDVSTVLTQISTEWLDNILKNPMAGKILGMIQSSLTQAIAKDLPAPPITFNLDDSIVSDMIDSMESLETTLADALVNLTDDVIKDISNQISADLSNPKQSYKNLAAGLQTFVSQLEVDAVKPLLDWSDDVVRDMPATAQAAVDLDPLITVDLTLLKDLLHLFGIGKKVDNSYSTSFADAVFIPMALVMWVALYMKTGKSISSIDELDLYASSPSPCSLGSEDVGMTDLTIANLALNFVAAEMGAAVWLVEADFKADGKAPPYLGAFEAGSVYLGMIRRACNITTYWVQHVDINTNKMPAINWVSFSFQCLQAVLSLAKLFTLGSPKDAPAGGPSTPKASDGFKIVGAIVTAGNIVLNVIETVDGSPPPSTDDILALTGSSLGSSQGVAQTLWDLWFGAVNPAPELLVFFTAYVAFAPYGFILQSLAISGALDAPEENTRGCLRDHGRRRKKREERLR